MPAPVSRPASGGPACPAPMMIASNSITSSRHDQEGAADRDHVLDERGRMIVAEGRRQAPRKARPPSVPDDRADHAGDEPRGERALAAPMAAPDRPPAMMRAPNCTGTVRLGVVGS